MSIKELIKESYLITINEAAQIMRVNRKVFEYEYFEVKKMPFIPRGNRKFIQMQDLKEFIELLKVSIK